MISWDELGCSNDVGAGAAGATGRGVEGRSVGDVTGDATGDDSAVGATGEELPLLVAALGAGAVGLF